MARPTPRTRTTKQAVMMVAAVLAVLPATPSRAQTAQPQTPHQNDNQGQNRCAIKLLASVPVTLVNNLPVISAAIDGQPLNFAVDTGSNVTIVTVATAMKLRLPPDPHHISRVMGVAPSTNKKTAIWNHDALIRSFSIGSLAVPASRIHVGLTPPSTQNHIVINGLIGTDLLSELDIDLDIEHSTINFYATKGCYGNYMPWNFAHSTHTDAWSSRSRLDRVSLPATLDGQPLKTVLDTASSISLISQNNNPALASLSVATDRSHTVDAAGNTVATSQIKDPDLNIDNIGRALPSVATCLCALPDEADLLIGEDFIRNHRLWLSAQTGTIAVQTP